MSSCLTISLVSERRPGPTSEVDDRGSCASLLPLAGWSRLRQWSSHAIGNRPEEGARDVQKMNDRGGKQVFLPKSTGNMRSCFAASQWQKQLGYNKGKIKQISVWDIHIYMNPRLHQQKNFFIYPNHRYMKDCLPCLRSKCVLVIARNDILIQNQTSGA